MRVSDGLCALWLSTLVIFLLPWLLWLTVAWIVEMLSEWLRLLEGWPPGKRSTTVLALLPLQGPGPVCLPRTVQRQRSSSLTLRSKTLFVKICCLCSLVFCLQNEVDQTGLLQVFYNFSDLEWLRLLPGYHFQMNQVWCHHIAGSCCKTEGHIPTSALAFLKWI